LIAAEGAPEYVLVAVNTRLPFCVGHED
jgi:hypothetical protein